MNASKPQDIAAQPRPGSGTATDEAGEPAPPQSRDRVPPEHEESPLAGEDDIPSDGRDPEGEKMMRDLGRDAAGAAKPRD